ncbi:MAG: hypothetical protein AAF846_15925 [Chloroflexota bacterium]
MTIKIRGFELPPLLEKFINDRVWGAKYADGRVNHHIIKIPDEMLKKSGIPAIDPLSTSNIDTLKFENTNEAWFPRKIFSSYASWRSAFPYYDSSKYRGEPITDSGILDIDKAIIIAGNISDDILCLDYRSNPPSIVAIDWLDQKFRTLAPDFETFAKGVGLID